MSEPAGRFVTHNELDTKLGQINTHIGALVEVLEGLNSNSTSGNSEVGKWRWSTLHGEQRRAMWDELREFVDWYNSRYGYAGEKRVIPPCWPLHPIAVEELTAQMVAWKAAHAQQDPTDWLRTFHEHLYPAIDRLHDPAIGGGFSRCTTRQHRVENLVEPVPISDEAFEAWVCDDLAACLPPTPED